MYRCVHVFSVVYLFNYRSRLQWLVTSSSVLDIILGMFRLITLPTHPTKEGLNGEELGELESEIERGKSKLRSVEDRSVSRLVTWYHSNSHQIA